MEQLSRTMSLCPVCLEKIPADIVQQDDRIFMCKECPRHGRHRVLISSSAQWYHRFMGVSSRRTPPVQATTTGLKGCPFDCGYCGNHAQRSCLPVVPVTSSCNLDCPVCYTLNKNRPAYHMTRDEFREILDQIRAQDPDMQIINFTGGEPLLHPAFCDLVAMCRQAGIQRITVSTNGLAFLTDDTLLPRLTELGARIVFSFNAFTPEPYVLTAGRDLLEKKLEILSLLAKYGPSTTLLTVAAAGVNDREIGDIVRYVLDHDFIVSSEIHTVTFTGRNQDRFDRATRLTTPDVMARVIARNPEMAATDFLPSPCAHPLCYATCYLLKLNDGNFIPFPRFVSEKEMTGLLSDTLYMEPTLSTEEILTDVLNRIWSKTEAEAQDRQVLAALKSLLGRMFPARGVDPETRRQTAERNTKAVYIHSHMDAENFDVSRIQDCCGAVPDGRGGNIPTCAYNVLYRGRDERFAEPSG